MPDLFGYEEPKIVYEDTLVCIKCNTRQPIDQFNAMKYANSQTDKQTEIKRTCRTCMRNQSNLVKDLKKKHPYPNRDYKCPICNLTEKEIRDRGAFQGFTSATSKTVWTLDHDHKTGKGRAYICDYCNIMIGRSLDNPKVLESGAAYLRKHNV